MTRGLRAIAPCLAVLAVLGLAAPAGADPPATGNGSQGKTAPATMSAAPGQPVQLDDRPRMTISHEVRRDEHHTAYLGAAAVALGVMVWWNRRRRERFDREDRAAPAARTERDDDGDALHAAARGNTPDPADASAAVEVPEATKRQDSSARQEARAASGAGEASEASEAAKPERRDIP